MIYIFGDSYGDPEYGNSINQGKTWYELLQDYHDVKNYSKAGTGPSYSLDIFEKTNINKNSIIIFLFSDILRHNFSFLKDPSHSSICPWIADNNDLFLETNFSKFVNMDKTKFYLLDHIDEIMNYYNNDIVFYNKQINQTIDRIYNLIRKYNSKIIFLPIFKKTKIPMSHQYIDYNFFDTYIFLQEISIKEYNVNTENFLYNEEFDNYNDSFIRRNHLSIDNHIVLFKNIMSIIDNTGEKIQFHEKNISIKKQIKTLQFIYE